MSALFKERRVEISFVDIGKRAPAPAELRRFSARLGAVALLDVDSKAYRDAGLGYLSMNDVEILERVVADPDLLRLPLVRNGSEVTIGVDEEAWRNWQERAQATALDAVEMRLDRPGR